MKTLLFITLFFFSIGFPAAGHHIPTEILIFETIKGETLKMEIAKEKESFDDIPEKILPAIKEGVTNPENHAYFQALMNKIRKDEKEEALPFCNNQAVMQF